MRLEIKLHKEIEILKMMSSIDYTISRTAIFITPKYDKSDFSKQEKAYEEADKLRYGSITGRRLKWQQRCPF